MTATNSYDLQLLFHQTAQGDEAAFTQLFEAFTPQLQPFVLKLTRNQEQTKEVIQETFLRLWVNRTELTKVEQPAAWIFRIASNVSINYLRSLARKRLQTIDADDTAAASDNEMALEAKELEGFIHQAVAALPEKRQQIYRLSREGGLTHQQIADQLGLSINTVKDQIGKALKNIQETISRRTGLSVITVMLLMQL